MAIRIDDVRYTNELASSGSTSYLQYNIGELVEFEVDFAVENFAIATTTRPIYLDAPGQPTTDWIEDTVAGGRFREFYIGDTILISNANTVANDGTYTIIDKSGDNLIRVSPAINTSESDTGVKIQNTTAVTTCQFDTNFIENSAGSSFASLTVPTQQQGFRSTGLDQTVTSFTTMTPLGAADWRVGFCQIKGRNLVGEEGFTIKWTTLLTPLYLSGQFADLQAGIPPSYFLSTNCLKHIYRIKATPSLDPNREYQITRDRTIGNTGWFDETFNGIATDYSIGSITYQRVSDSQALSAVQLDATEETLVTITVLNDPTKPFDAGLTKATISMWWLPDDTAAYQQQNENLGRNYYADRALQTEGAAAVNGDNFGTDRQIIKDYTISFVNTGEITIQFTTDFATEVVDGILGFTNNPRYVIGVNVQDHTLAQNADDLDRVQLKADAQAFFLDLTDTDLMSFTNKFLIHYQNDVTDLQIENSFLPEDLVVAYTTLLFDRTNGLPTISSLTGEITVENDLTGESFSVEEFTLTMPTGEVSGAQFVDFSQDRAFKLPYPSLPQQIRQQIKIERDFTLDADPVYGYRFTYPFSFRWEDWIANPAVNNAFFSVSEQNNGLNYDWRRYNPVANWQMYWRVTAGILQNGQRFSTSARFQIDSAGYAENTASWDNLEIRTFDESGSPQLISGSDNFIYGAGSPDDTLFEADFEYIAGTSPAVGDVAMVMRIEVFEEGGRFGIYELSTEYDDDGNSWLKSTDTSNRVVLTKSVDTYTGKCLIDSSKLPTGKFTFKLSARIYLKISATALLTEDLQAIQTEDDNDIEIEY